MRTRIAGLAVVLTMSVPGAALADECVERFRQVQIGQLDPKPTRGRIKAETNGTPSENEFFQVHRDHLMFKPVVPANIPWTLTYEGGMYQSSDEGKSWRKVHSFDAEETLRQQRENVQEQSQTAANVVCGTEEWNGRTYDTVRGDTRMTKPMKLDVSSKYWVEPDTGFVARADLKMVSSHGTSTYNQVWEPAPDLELPVPE